VEKKSKKDNKVDRRFSCGERKHEKKVVRLGPNGMGGFLRGKKGLRLRGREKQFVDRGSVESNSADEGFFFCFQKKKKGKSRVPAEVRCFLMCGKGTDDILKGRASFASQGEGLAGKKSDSSGQEAKVLKKSMQGVCLGKKIEGKDRHHQHTKGKRWVVVGGGWVCGGLGWGCWLWGFFFAWLWGAFFVLSGFSIFWLAPFYSERGVFPSANASVEKKTGKCSPKKRGEKRVPSDFLINSSPGGRGPKARTSEPCF